jgi:hypothetical protein
MRYVDSRPHIDGVSSRIRRGTAVDQTERKWKKKIRCLCKLLDRLLKYLLLGYDVRHNESQRTKITLTGSTLSTTLVQDHRLLSLCEDNCESVPPCGWIEASTRHQDRKQLGPLPVRSRHRCLMAWFHLHSQLAELLLPLMTP